MAKIGEIIDGKYKILEEIGRGGMSIVYLARDSRLNKSWAIKEIKKKGNTRDDQIIVNSLLTEANLIKRLDHESIVRIVDIIEDGTTIYIVMDYIEGQSLDKIIKEYGAQPEELVVEWAMQLCDALFYLHSQKPPIIYRDMKPANIMLKPDGNIKIIDFGIAREYKEKNLADTTLLGTKGYAPPEQYDGKKQTDARSDIYALGMTMHHLLTGIDPRGSQEYASVRNWNPEISEGMEIIIDKCVEEARENRYQNCQELLYALVHRNELLASYKRKQKIKLYSFAVSLLLMFVFALSGFICRNKAISINNNEYDKLISISEATDLNNKIENYKEAIKIYPYRTEAYMNILEAYEDEGKFGKEENDEFLALFNPNKAGFDSSSEEAAELYYKIGTMYFNYYIENDEQDGLATRAQKAYSFFKTNFDNEDISDNFKNSQLNNCYYQICNFYKKYILNSSIIDEASKKDYEELLVTMEDTMQSVKKAGVYDQLLLYNGILRLLYDQRHSLVQTNVEEQNVLDVMSEVYSAAHRIDSEALQKERTKNLKKEIESNYEGYVLKIKEAYDDTKGEK